MPQRKDLADTLLEEHAVQPDALERARRECERSGRPLWAVLLDQGLCTEEQIFRSLQHRGGVSVVPADRLSGLVVPSELLAALPRELAVEMGVLPLERSADGRRVALAMVDPLAETPRIRAALARLGVQEVHRFLMHRALFRRYLAAIYDLSRDLSRRDTERSSAPPGPGQPAANLPLSDRPTGIVSLPERDAQYRGRRRQDEATELLPGRQRRDPRGPEKRTPRAALLSPPVQPIAPTTPRMPGPITQPMVPVPAPSERPSSVQIDPQLVREIELLGGAPRDGAREPAAEFATSPATAVRGSRSLGSSPPTPVGGYAGPPVPTVWRPPEPGSQADGPKRSGATLRSPPATGNPSARSVKGTLVTRATEPAPPSSGTPTPLMLPVVGSGPAPRHPLTGPADTEREAHRAPSTGSDAPGSSAALASASSAAPAPSSASSTPSPPAPSPAASSMSPTALIVQRAVESLQALLRDPSPEPLASSARRALQAALRELDAHAPPAFPSSASPASPAPHAPHAPSSAPTASAPLASLETALVMAPTRSQDSTDPDRTRQLALPTDPDDDDDASDPELEIEMAEISEAGLEVYQDSLTEKI